MFLQLARKTSLDDRGRLYIKSFIVQIFRRTVLNRLVFLTFSTCHRIHNFFFFSCKTREIRTKYLQNAWVCCKPSKNGIYIWISRRRTYVYCTSVRHKIVVQEKRTEKKKKCNSYDFSPVCFMAGVGAKRTVLLPLRTPIFFFLFPFFSILMCARRLLNSILYGRFCKTRGNQM